MSDDDEGWPDENVPETFYLTKEYQEYLQMVTRMPKDFVTESFAGEEMITSHKDALRAYEDQTWATPPEIPEDPDSKASNSEETSPATKQPKTQEKVASEEEVTEIDELEQALAERKTQWWYKR